jgi:hypothetical protein
MRGRYLFSRYLGECFRPLTLVVAIGTFATGPAARAQGVSDHSISALPAPENPGDSTPTADHVRTTTEPPRFDPNSAAAVRARQQQVREEKEKPKSVQAKPTPPSPNAVEAPGASLPGREADKPTPTLTSGAKLNGLHEPGPSTPPSDSVKPTPTPAPKSNAAEMAGPSPPPSESVKPTSPPAPKSKAAEMAGPSPGTDSRVLDPWADEPAKTRSEPATTPAANRGTNVETTSAPFNSEGTSGPAEMARPAATAPSIEAPQPDPQAGPNAPSIVPAPAAPPRSADSAPAETDRPLPMSEGLKEQPGNAEPPRPTDSTVSQGVGDRPLPSSGSAGDPPAGASPEPTAQGPVIVPVEVAPPTEADSYAPSQSSVPTPQPSAPRLSTPSLSTPDPSVGPGPGDRFDSAPVPSP